MFFLVLEQPARVGTGAAPMIHSTHQALSVRSPHSHMPWETGALGVLPWAAPRASQPFPVTITSCISVPDELCFPLCGHMWLVRH